MTEPTRGLSRRDFLRLGLVAGRPRCVGRLRLGRRPGARRRSSALFSRVNDWVGEKIFLSRPTGPRNIR